MDLAFVLNRRPFRDNSLIVDLLTQESGRIVCIARIAKRRGKIIKGVLEPFRLLQVDWIGKGEVQTLTLADERGKFHIAPADLVNALYVNELVLKLVPGHAPAQDIFHTYQFILRQFANPRTHVLPLCEMALLETLGYPLRLKGDAKPDSGQSYRFTLEGGVQHADETAYGVPVAGSLLTSLAARQPLDDMDHASLRTVLDRIFDLLLAGRKLHSRKLAFARH